MADHLEQRIVDERQDVLLVAGEVVVDADHLVAAFEQARAKVGTEEAGAAGDENAFWSHGKSLKWWSGCRRRRGLSGGRSASAEVVVMIE
ncbi:MAG: hypothetical protein M5U09_07405 [Gammaproteobacteria bacterium]|nr:hypothetical protein [Gammaproteobacteria bacterium]